MAGSRQALDPCWFGDGMFLYAQPSAVSIWIWNRIPALRDSILTPLVALLLCCYPFSTVPNIRPIREVENHRGIDLWTQCYCSDPVLFGQNSCGLDMFLFILITSIPSGEKKVRLLLNRIDGISKKLDGKEF